MITVNSLKLLPRLPRTPRVTIDRMVVCREAWNFPASELRFAYLKDGAERFLEARRWALSHDIPRLAFVKVPAEVKPVYVDFASTIFVDLFAKLIRRTVDKGMAEEVVTVTEMFPDMGRIWLHDAEGLKYTSEFRTVAVDLLGTNVRSAAPRGRLLKRYRQGDGR
jgi:hypothetical protein